MIIALCLIFFVTEGLGLLKFNYFYYQYFLLFFPSLLYLYLIFIKRKKLSIPVFPILFYLLYIAFTLTSSLFFSLDKQVSFEKTLVLIGLLFIFIFFYNFKDLGNKLIKFLPFLGLILSSIYLLLLRFKNLIPVTEKQFVWPIYGGHNHLGDFLGLVIIILFWQLLDKKRISKLLYLILFLLFFCFSFSRSAYIALALTVFLILLTLKKKIFSAKSLFLILLPLILTILITFKFKIKPLTDTQKYFSKNFSLNKELFSGRDEYFRQSWESFKEKPFFGVGPGNFVYASKKYDDKNIFSDSAHNLFLEILVENGIFATLFWLFFTALIIFQAIKHKALAGFLALYLLFNFQMDYTYQIFSFGLLFLITSALALNSVLEIKLPTEIFGISSLLLFLLLVVIITSNFFVEINEPYLALEIYPLNKTALKIAIKEQEEVGVTIYQESYLSQMQKVAPYDAQFVQMASSYYLNENQKEKALSYLIEFYQINKYIDLPWVEQIYDLKKEVISEQAARDFLNQIITNYRKISYSYIFSERFKDLCIKKTGDLCWSVGWY